MSRTYLAIILSLLIFALTVGTVLALVSGPPAQDTYVDKNTSEAGVSHDGMELRVQGSNLGTCDAVRTAYMQWNLQDLSAPAGWAQLNLTVTSTPSNAAGQTISLYRTTDGWDESLTYNTPAPAVGALIESVTLPSGIASGAVVSFGGTDAALLQYINEKVGQPSISFALKFSTCATTSLIWFLDSESGTGAPNLEVRTAAPPNAVDVSSTSAERTSLPLYAGLGAVALILVAGLAISRRRTA